MASSPNTRPARSGVGVLGRIVARTGLGLWQRKGTLLVGAATVAALAAFVTLAGPSSPAASAPSRGAGSDCADTAIAAIVQKTSDSVQQAYDCMEPSFQQRVPEAQFAQQFGSQTPAASDASPEQMSRVADYHNQDGGQLVYYALSNGNQSVGYIVYLDAQGKIAKVE
ncbi:MAG: hypothetical protein JO023_19875 [Chloroflexi bacterium]|nr:hypothetical protein [Chloroflexota bacterium]